MPITGPTARGATRNRRCTSLGRHCGTSSGDRRMLGASASRCCRRESASRTQARGRIWSSSSQIRRRVGARVAGMTDLGTAPPMACCWTRATWCRRQRMSRWRCSPPASRWSSRPSPRAAAWSRAAGGRRSRSPPFEWPRCCTLDRRCRPWQDWWTSSLRRIKWSKAWCPSSCSPSPMGVSLSGLRTSRSCPPSAATCLAPASWCPWSRVSCCWVATSVRCGLRRPWAFGLPDQASRRPPRGRGR
mmetsp:Transcript_131175/g.419621  ORF Transcript_131175/g.419621 Transcript_131175/m.419621 type:complete len:245 (+) Transcript_131175:190-924(+)